MSSYLARLRDHNPKGRVGTYAFTQGCIGEAKLIGDVEILSTSSSETSPTARGKRTGNRSGAAGKRRSSSTHLPQGKRLRAANQRPEGAASSSDPPTRLPQHAGVAGRRPVTAAASNAPTTRVAGKRPEGAASASASEPPTRQLPTRRTGAAGKRPESAASAFDAPTRLPRRTPQPVLGSSSSHAAQRTRISVHHNSDTDSSEASWPNSGPISHTPQRRRNGVAEDSDSASSGTMAATDDEVLLEACNDDDDAPLPNTPPAARNEQIFEASDDEGSLMTIATSQVSTIPAIASLSQLRQEAAHRTFNDMYVDLKVVAIQETTWNNSPIIQVFCVGVLQQETIQSCVQVQAVLNQRSQTQSVRNEALRREMYRRMARLSIFNTTLSKVQRNIKILDVIRVLKFTSLKLFNNVMPQMNIGNLRYIQVRDRRNNATQ